MNPRDDKRHEDDGHGNALGSVYVLRCAGSNEYHDYVTAESYEAMKRRAEHAYPYPEAEDWTVEELAAAYRERLKDIEQYRQWVERLQTTPSHEQRIHEGRGSQPAGALVSGSPHLAAREANPGSAVPGGVDRHERRVVGHASGWQEQMDTCVCGKPWPCASAASTTPQKPGSTYIEPAMTLLNAVKAWRDSDGNEGFPHLVREGIDALLMAYELRTHGTSGTMVNTVTVVIPS